MMKRTFSFLLVLTMLATCLVAVPVLAEPAEALTDITPGGEWAEKVIMNNDALLGSGSKTDGAGGLTYNKTTHTATQGGYYGTVKLTNFDDLNINNDEDGELEISMDVTPTGTIETFRKAEDSKNFAMSMRVIPYIDGAAKYAGEGGHYFGMFLEYNPASGENPANVKYGFPWGSNKTAFTFGQGTAIPVKYLVTKKDGKLTADMQVQIGGVWKTGSTANMAKFETNVTATSGKFTGLGMNFGSDGFSANAGTMDWVFSNASVIQKTPKTARLSDLSENAYSADAVVPIDFVLPVDYTAASLKVNGQVVKTFDQAAGAYTANLNLEKIAGAGLITIELSGVANGKAFSKTTTVKKTPVSDVTPGGEWADNKVIMDNDALLNGGTSASSNVEYNKATYQATHKSYYGGMKFVDFNDLMLNREDDGVLEISMKAAVTSSDGTVATFKGTASNSLERSIRFIPYVDGIGLNGGSAATNGVYAGETGSPNRSYGLNIFYSSTTGAMRYRFPRTGTSQEYTLGTAIPVKLLVEKKDGTLTTLMQAKIGDNWLDGTSAQKTATSTTVTETTGKFTGLGLQFGSESYSGSGNPIWTFSDASVIQKTPKTARLSDLSESMYFANAKVPVDLVLPVGYTEASLKVNGETLLTFDGEEAGAYTMKLDLAGFDATRMLVEFSGVANGKAFSKTTTIIKNPASDVLPGGQWAEKEIMDNDTLLGTRATTTGSTKYNQATHTMTQGSYYNYFKMVDFKDLAINREDDGELEIRMNVTPSGKVETFRKSGSTGSITMSFRFFPYVNGSATDVGSSIHHYGLYLKQASSTAAMTYGFPWGSNATDFTFGTTIPVKYTVTKEDGKLTAAMQAQIGGVWRSGSTSNKAVYQTNATSTFTGVGFNIGSDGFSSNGGTLDWKFSDATVVQKTPKTARLSDLSQRLFRKDETVPVDFVLPVGYTEASLTVNGTAVKTFTSDAYPAGAYTTTLDMAKIDAEGPITLELSGTAGSAFSKTTQINKTEARISLTPGGKWADKQVMTEKEFLETKNKIPTSTSNPIRFNKTTHTLTLSGTSGNFNQMVEFNNLSMINEDDGVLEIEMDVTPIGTFAKAFPGKVDGSAVAFRFISYVGTASWAYTDRFYRGLALRYDAANDKVVYGFPTGTENTQDFDFDNPTPVRMKYVMEKKDGNLISKNLAKINGEWVNAGGFATETSAITNGTKFLVGVRASTQYYDSSTNPSEQNWEFANVSVTEKAPKTVRLQDLAGAACAKDGIIPLDVVLPENYDYANFMVKGKPIATVNAGDYVAGGYTAYLDLKLLDEEVGDTVELTFAGTADGAPFSKTTTFTVVDGGEITVSEMTAADASGVITTTIQHTATAIGATGKLVVAAYKTVDGVAAMQEVQLHTVIAAQTAEATQKVTTTLTKEYDYVKVFIWDSFGMLNSMYDMQPINKE